MVILFREQSFYKNTLALARKIAQKLSISVKKIKKVE